MFQFNKYRFVFPILTVWLAPMILVEHTVSILFIKLYQRDKSLLRNIIKSRMISYCFIEKYLKILWFRQKSSAYFQGVIYPSALPIFFNTWCKTRSLTFEWFYLSHLPGRVGPGDSGWIHDALFDDVGHMAYHGAVHDAFGYLITWHNIGPGYDYRIGMKKVSENCMSGQATGIHFWRHIMDVMDTKEKKIVYVSIWYILWKLSQDCRFVRRPCQ